MIHGIPNVTTWLLDSDAFHHIIDDLVTLSIHKPYDGPDDLVIGDGLNLHISHNDSFSIPSSHKKLLLNNVLYVPKISLKCLTISQFCHNNNVNAILSYSSFFYKGHNNESVTHSRTNP